MNERVAALLQRIHQLEEELATEFSAAQKRFHYYVSQGRVYFEEGIVAQHLRVRRSAWNMFAGAQWRDIPAGLATVALAAPLAALDLSLFLYQSIAFSLYRIPKVRRADFIVLDRHQLSYLNWVEKLNCAYCGYANGLLAYAKVVAGRTEQFWCPIKHARRVHAPHTRYGRFFDYGDATAYRNELERIRAELTERKRDA